jgi:hypothetical protein
MKKYLTSLLCLFALAACGGDDGDSSLMIQNDSDFAFIELNISPVDSNSWGADLLGVDVLLPGEAVEITNIDCDDYDVRIVDEDGDECIIDDYSMCFDADIWVIDNAMLAICTAF